MPAAAITVLSIVRNQMRWIDGCAASVLRQEGVALDWVVVDNGSDDGTAEKIRAWAARDARVRPVLLNHNLHYNGGIVRGLDDVRSPFVALLDGDDEALPGRLARSLEWLEADATRRAVYHNCEFVDGADQPMPPWFIARDAGALRRLAEFTMPAISSASAFRTDWLRRHAPLAPFGNTTDCVLLGFALEQGDAGFLPETLTRYRVHAASESQRRPWPQFAQGCATRLWAAGRRSGRVVDVPALIAWAEGVAQSARTEGDVDVAVARQAWSYGLPRLALYHARRAVRRGHLASLGIVCRVLATTSWREHELGPILRGGLLAAARVDGSGHSIA